MYFIYLYIYRFLMCSKIFRGSYCSEKLLNLVHTLYIYKSRKKDNILICRHDVDFGNLISVCYVHWRPPHALSVFT